MYFTLVDTAGGDSEGIDLLTSGKRKKDPMEVEMMKQFVIGLSLAGCCLCIVFVPSASAQIGPDVVVKLEEFAHNNRLGPVGKGVIGAGKLTPFNGSPG